MGFSRLTKDLLIGTMFGIYTVACVVTVIIFYVDSICGF